MMTDDGCEFTDDGCTLMGTAASDSPSCNENDLPIIDLIVSSDCEGIYLCFGSYAYSSYDDYAYFGSYAYLSYDVWYFDDDYSYNYSGDHSSHEGSSYSYDDDVIDAASAVGVAILALAGAVAAF